MKIGVFCQSTLPSFDVHHTESHPRWDDLKFKIVCCRVLVCGLSDAGVVRTCDIVHDDLAAVFDERSVIRQIMLDAFVRVVAVNEQNVDARRKLALDRLNIAAVDVQESPLRMSGENLAAP